MQLSSLIAQSVDMKVCPGYAEAQRLALEEAALPGGQPFPAILFRRGTRGFAWTTLPIGVIQ